jgi:hypothetical protein
MSANEKADAGPGEATTSSTEVERATAQLYARILLEAVSGPFTRAIHEELGAALVPLWDALLERHEERLYHRTPTVPMDDIDWAAIRVTAPAMLRIYDEGTFQTIAGRSLADLAELEQMAIAAWREYRVPHHAISYRIGPCVVELPVRYIAMGTRLAGVPDDDSWNSVVPECARDRREEFLTPLRREFEKGGAGHIWEERLVGSLRELREWVDEQAAPFEAERRKRWEARPRRP